MAKDISRKSVMILVTVALIVSILSTLFVLNTVYTYQPPTIKNEEVIYNTGTVVFTVSESAPTATARLNVPEPKGG